MTARLIPITLDNWFTLTSTPRRCGGDNSAMYMGDDIIANPIPTPPTKRHMPKSQMVTARALPIVDIIKKNAASIIVLRRPIRSVNQRPNKGPVTAPSMALLTANPFMAAER